MGGRVKAENFGKNLERNLKWLQMSQIELAEKTGLTPAAISQIVNGERIPNLKSVIKILGVIPMTFENFMKDVEP